MPKLVIHGAKLKCSEGLAPSTLTVLPVNGSSADEQPAATVMDHVPMVNVAPFGMCKTQANPQVAAATAAGTVTGVAPSGAYSRFTLAGSRGGDFCGRPWAWWA